MLGRERTSAVADCNAPARDSITMLEVPGNPFQALPSADGCWIFVSLANVAGSHAGIAVVHRDGGKTSVERVIGLSGNPTGMQLTHDGRLLVVADGNRLAFVDAAHATSGRGNAVLGYLDEPGMLGRIYVNVTADDKYAFVADERANTITIVDLAEARRNGFRASAIVGKIPTGPLPISVVFSPDGKLLYVTSEMAPTSLGWKSECAREGAAANDASPVNPQGAILVVDVERALKDPARSVIAAVGAGCSSVRLVLSPTAERAYVSARNSNALLVFDRRHELESIWRHRRGGQAVAERDRRVESRRRRERGCRLDSVRRFSARDARDRRRKDSRPNEFRQPYGRADRSAARPSPPQIRRITAARLSA
jgi:DNA-binding beta-propeller fold protein YncE